MYVDSKSQQNDQAILQSVSVGGTGLEGLGGADASVYLTPDALMAYCESRLNSIDSQVQTAFVQQELRNGEQGDLQQILGLLQTYQSGIGDIPNNKSDQGTCAKIEQAMAAEIHKLQAEDPNNPDLGKLIQAYNDFVWTGTGPTSSTPYIDQQDFPPNQNGNQGDGMLSDTEMKGFMDTIQGISSDLNSGAELQMIQLQSLMSQRQTAIQLTTNLVQSIGDQLNKIADNIGH